MLNTFLFDLDGTLTDSQKGITNCLLYALQELQHSPLPSQEQLSGYIGMALRECFERLLSTNDGATIDRAIELYRTRFWSEGKFENAVYAGIPEALEHLRSSDAKLYVATSKPVDAACEILQHFELAHYFERIYGSLPDGTRENKAELIAYVIAEEKLNTSTTIMVGDRRYDIIGGRSNHTATAGVTWGYGTPEELRQAGADSIIERPHDLTSLRSGLGKRNTPRTGL